MSSVKVDFDRDVWLYVPESWPWQGFDNVDIWADTTVRLLAEAYELDDETAQWLGMSLRSITNDRPDQESRFIYLANPGGFIFFLSVASAPTDERLSLESLAGSDDPTVTRQPELEHLESPGMGRGVRTLRYADIGDPSHDIAAIYQYAWRSGGLDVVVIASNFNIPLLLELQPAIDELALSISVVD